MSGVLQALVIVFIVLCSAGLLIYAVFFTIHKVFFRQVINLSKKYNDLITGLGGINIFKIQVLANNNIGKRGELEKYIDVYQKIRQNSNVIKANISIAIDEINTFNLKIAKKYISSIDKDLNKSLKDLSTLKNAYDKYTQYGYAVDYTYQNYHEIFEALTCFYNDKIKFVGDFDKVNKLISTIRSTFISIPKLSNKFDYKKTVDTMVDLAGKLKTLANIIFVIFKFQLVDSYLITTRDFTQQLISKHSNEISRSDLQTIQNLLTVFKHNYKHFNENYRKFGFAQARKFGIQAIGALNQINQFTYVHFKTPALIDLSIGQIKEQTDRIIANREDILESINDLKQYFVLEPKIISHFDAIESNVKAISDLNLKANRINYKTHTEKIRAVKDLDRIANQIVTHKDEIVSSIDYINTILSKVITTVTDLNDLYVYFWQLLAIVNQFVPSGVEKTNLQHLIKSNLSSLEGYSKQIISQDQPDFDEIAYQITSIIDQSHQIYKQMTSIIILKTYASKLFIYANRYKKYNDLKDEFTKANKQFKEKKYDTCIETLLSIIKASKKHKK